MVSNRCKMIVKSELEEMGLHFIFLEMGEVEIMENLTADYHNQLNYRLNLSGLGLLDDRKSMLIEKIKNIIVELVYHSDKQLVMNFSDFLSEKLNYNYTYLANLFSESQGTTIEQFLLTHKIERVKELLVYDDLTLTEIADMLHYSSVAHLSNQFKKMTGLTPSNYKNLRLKSRRIPEKI